MRFRQKRILRRWLEQLNAERAKNGMTMAQADGVSAVLVRGARFNTLVEMIDEKLATEIGVEAWGDGTLLKWLWEHREEILAFILKIVDLFN